MKASIFALAVAALAIAGCATGPAYRDPGDPPSGKAQLILYREFALGGGAYPMNFWLDGKEFASLWASGYTVVSVAPGAHKLSVGQWGNQAHSQPFEVKASQRVYFLVSTDTSNITAFSASAVVVTNSLVVIKMPPEKAQADLVDYKFSAPLIAEIK